PVDVPPAAYPIPEVAHRNRDPGRERLGWATDDIDPKQKPKLRRLPWDEDDAPGEVSRKPYGQVRAWSDDTRSTPDDCNVKNRSACRGSLRSDTLEPIGNRHHLHGDDRQSAIRLDTFHNSHERKIRLEPGVDPGGVYALRAV